MVRRLPPFGPLIAFDAVARHRSFTRAADELGVTQSAVSHRIRRLERYFDVPLLCRLNPGLELTKEGTALRRDLAGLLDGMAGLEPSLRRSSEKRHLRLGAGSAVSTWWLVRRLASFQAEHPELTIEFEPVESGATPARPCDIRIVWTSLEEARATSLQAPLFQERVVPVCAPHLLRNGRPLTDPRDLVRLPLIQKGIEPDGEWSWGYWFTKLGLKSPPRAGLLLRDMSLCLTAAVDGGGVALGRSLLVADALADGRLTPALEGTPFVASSKVHVAQWSPELIGDRATQLLVTWLAREAAMTVSNGRAVEPVREARELGV